MERIRAENCAEAFWTLDPYAVIQPDDPWHTDIDSFFDREHYRFSSEFLRFFKPQRGRPPYSHLGIVGHGGSGKTTQVRKAMGEIKSLGIQPVFVDALIALDQGDFTFSDLMLVIAKAVAAALAEDEVEIASEQLELVKQWFAEELLSENHKREILGSIETEAKGETGIPYLVKLMAKITATLKSSNEYRTEIRRKADRDVQDLVRRTNLLLDAANQGYSQKRGAPCTLAVVIDNLEKLKNLEKLDLSVLSRSEELRQLRCHLVLFFDPASQYAPLTVQASQAFDVLFVPMLPVRGRYEDFGVVDIRAFDAIKDLLSRRVVMEKVFSNEVCVWDIARYSGGRLRDVFHIARLACSLADPDRVEPKHIETAARKLRGERTSLAKPEHWPRLAEIHRQKEVVNSVDDGHLLLHSLVLNYNGEPWWDIHPLVELDQRYKTEWAKLNPPP